MKCSEVVGSLVLLFSVTIAYKETIDLEKILLDIVQNKTDKYDSLAALGLTGKECFETMPEKPDFSAPGRSISEAKCLEYQWILEQKEIEAVYMERCRAYMVTELKKGVIPEIFFLVDIPVIFGGRAAQPGEFPHMGAIGWKAKDPEKKWIFKCGSTLISPKFAMTAAHCSYLSTRRAPDIADPSPKIIRFGVEHINEDDFQTHGDPADIHIKRIIKHPRFAPPKKYYDIALIELERDVTLDVNMFPACIWSQWDTRPLGDEVALTGWGYTEKGNPSDVLQVAYVNLLNPWMCNGLLSKSYNRNWWGFSNHQLCAGNLTGGIDTCQGDSGGPIQVKIQRPNDTSTNLHMVVGVTSFGVKCGRKNEPGVYTNVASFVDWIEHIVWGNEPTNFTLFG